MRSATWRYGGFWRWIFRKPVALPIGRHLSDGGGRRELDQRQRRQRPLVVARHHLRELQRRRAPRAEQARAQRAAGQLHMTRDHIDHEREIVAVERLEID